VLTARNANGRNFRRERPNANFSETPEVYLTRPTKVKPPNVGERLILLALAKSLACLAGALHAIERLAPDHFHAADSHLAELLAVLRDARAANRRKLGGAL
jgi:hypothetical protein